MKIGICTGFGRDPKRDTPAMWKYIKGLGYDHIECGAIHLTGIAEEDYDAHCACCHKIGLVVGAVNCFFPGDMKLIGIDRSSNEEITAHVSRVFNRMERIGAKTIVFGSGKARTIPDGMSREEGLFEIRAILRLIAPLAEAHGITVAIEPLNSAETNVFTNLADTYAMVRELELSSIRMLADSFHMSEAGESAEIPAEYIPYLAHTHIAEAGNRRYPGNSGGDYVKRMLYGLREQGYEGSVSVECQIADMHKDPELIMAFLKEIGIK